MNLEELTLRDLLNFCTENPEMEVSLADSEAAGNCSAGSREFMDEYFPGRTTATLKELSPLVEGSRGLRLVVEYKLRKSQEQPAEETEEETTEESE